MDPWGQIVPQYIECLICPGRAVSVERDLLDPLRVMALCMAMGEAAGVAAALSLRTQTPFGALDVRDLREKLQAAGSLATGRTRG